MKAITLALAFTALVQLSAAQGNLVCYFASWAVNRPGNGQFDVENIDPQVCTHLVYAFAGLDEATNTIISLAPENDLSDNGGRGAYQRFTGLKQLNPELKTTLSIGGWNEGSEKYSQMARDPAARTVFVNSVVRFLLQFGFDGLDLDWEFPTSRGGIPEDKENFVLLSRELKAVLEPHGLTLTAAVSCGRLTIDSAYDVSAINEIFDYIHLMCYDFHGDWESYTGHNSPLYGNPDIDLEESAYFNTEFAVYYWVSKGGSPGKLILGMPLYARGFLLDDASNSGFYAPASSPVPGGPYTNTPGFWGYNEVCEKFETESGWTRVRDSFYQVPYAINGRQWVGYDDQASLRLKAQYARNHFLGGAMVWSIDTDSFRGCDGSEPFPLLKAIRSGLSGQP